MSFTPVPHACRAFLADFSAFIDGELPAAKRNEYQAHVDCCQSCLGHLTAYRRGITVLRSLEETAPVDLWTRLEERLWLGPSLSLVEGGADDEPRRRVPRWSRPAVSLAAAAVLALFFIVRGLGPGTTPGEVGPRTVSASVAMTVPEVPPGGQALAAATGPAPTTTRRARRGAPTPVAEPAATIVRAGIGVSLGPDSDRSWDAAGRQSLGRAADRGLAADGWVRPVRLGSGDSRASIIPASLVRPASAVRPAPWTVDRAVSLP